MATEEILLKYKADITDLQAKVGAIEAQFKKTSAAAVDSQDKIKKGFSATAAASTGLQSSLKALGGAIVAAFAVERIIAFGQASLQAAIEAEKAETKLNVALNGRKDIQERLLFQAKELQKAIGISDEVIIEQQTFLAIQGRTEAQIKKIIQASVELSKVTGESLQESVRKLDGTYEGVIGRLGKLDSGFKNLTKEQLANGAAVDLVLEKYEGFAAQSTQNTSGAIDRLRASFDELQEAIGKNINKGGPFINFLDDVFNGLQRFFTSNFDLAVQDNIDQTTRNVEAFIKTFEEFRKKAREGGDLRTDFELAQVLIKETNESIIEENKRLTSASTQEQKSRSLERIAILQAEKDALLSFLKDEETARKNAAKAGEADRLKAQEEAAKAQKKQLEDQAKAQEEFRKFTLKSLDENAKFEAATQKELAAERITNEQELAKEFDRIDLELLEKQKQNRIDTNEDITEIETQLSEKRLQIRLNEIKADKEAGKQLLADIEQRAKDQIEVLEKVKDDPATKVNEEQEAQAKILRIRADAANATEFILNRLLEAGILNEEEYTKIFRELAQERKLIKADEDAARLASDKKTTQELIDNILQLADDSIALLEKINGFNQAQTQSEIEAINQREEAQNEAFDREQERIEEQAEKRIITEAQAENQSAELKKKRAASEKLSNDAINALKRKQAENDKLLSIFRLTLILAEAIADLNFFKAAIAAVELATVIATPVPKFFKGTPYLERGKNPMGRDTIPIYANEGERIVPTEQNLKHWDVYQAIDENRLDKYIHKTFVVPKLKEQQRIYEQSKETSFAESVGRSVDFSPFVEKLYHDNDYLRRKGVTLNNVKQIAKETAKEVSTEIVRTLIREGKI